MADDTKTAEGTETGADQPGKPAEHDIDPELVALPRPPRGRIGPVLALSVIVFCGYIMFRLYGDVRFSRQPAEPRVFASPAELLERAEPEQLVRVPAVPDRAFAVKVAHSMADDGSRLAPVLGANGELWIMLSGNVWTAGIRYEEVYTGRLREVNDLPFAEDLRRHVGARGPEPRFLVPEDARATLDSQAPLRDPSGDTIEVAADTPVQVYQTVLGQARIQVFPLERLPGPSEWTAALAEIGLVPADAEPHKGPKGSWIYIAEVPGGAPTARDKLREAKLFSARSQPVKRTHETTWGELASRGDALVVDGQPLPWASIDWIGVDVERDIPDDALVLLTQERPDAYWYVLPVFGLLALSVLIFAWALVRSLRDSGARRAQNAEQQAGG